MSARTYRVSALASGFACMCRAWKIVVPTIVINALVQALLVLPDPVPGQNWWFWPLILISFLALVKSYHVVASAVFLVIDGSDGPAWRAVIWSLRRRLLLLLAWAVALLVVVVIGLSLYLVPGLIVILLTPFVLLAVVDGHSRPLATNVATIRDRWGRWLLTSIVMGILCAMLWVPFGLNGFFVTGAPAALIAWLVLGVVASWFITAWALIYRSVNAPAA